MIRANSRACNDIGCLRHAIPDRVPAEGAGTLWNVATTGPRTPGDFHLGTSEDASGGVDIVSRLASGLIADRIGGSAC
jgi:hypothetical protein